MNRGLILRILGVILCYLIVFPFFAFLGWLHFDGYFFIWMLMPLAYGLGYLFPLFHLTCLMSVRIFIPEHLGQFLPHISVVLALFICCVLRFVFGLDSRQLYWYFGCHLLAAIITSLIVGFLLKPDENYRRLSWGSLLPGLAIVLTGLSYSLYSYFVFPGRLLVQDSHGYHCMDWLTGETRDCPESFHDDF